GSLRSLHSFPTRRSSDLADGIDDGSGAESCSGSQDVAQGLDHLIGCCAPGLGLSIDLFEGMDDVRIVQRHIRLAERGAVTRVERSEEHTSELQSRFDLVC